MALWNQMQTCIPHRPTLSSWNSAPIPSKFTFFFQFGNADILMKDHVPIEYKDPSGLHLHINICTLVILDWLAKLSVLSHLLTRVNYLSSLIANKKWCTFSYSTITWDLVNVKYDHSFWYYDHSFLMISPKRPEYRHNTNLLIMYDLNTMSSIGFYELSCTHCNDLSLASLLDIFTVVSGLISHIQVSA